MTIACLLNRVRLARSSIPELVDRIEDAFTGVEVDDKMPSLERRTKNFVAALVTYRDTKMGRSTEWGN